MPEVKRWYGTPNHEVKTKKQVLKFINCVDTEPVYYIEFSDDPPETEEARLFLRRLLGSGHPTATGRSAADTPHLYVEDDRHQFIVEIGPKLLHKTGWCSNVMSILSNTCVSLRRIETSCRYRVTVTPDCDGTLESIRQQFLEELCDPLLQMEYKEPITQFSGGDTQQWAVEEIDIMTRGAEAILDANNRYNLGCDADDVKFFYELFRDGYQRNPTHVELYDIAQCYSEHSRHWLFRGAYFINGVRNKLTMMDLVMNTNSDVNNSIVKFSDNSSVIRGHTLPVMRMTDPTTMSPFKVLETDLHLLLTAETHNFPTGVCPFSGSATGVGGRQRDVMAAGQGGYITAGIAGYCVGQLNVHKDKMPWENLPLAKSDFVSPLKILIEASDGASDYGNKFGEPLIGGFCRVFGSKLGHERMEWLKPIMFSAGLGTIDGKHLFKKSIDENRKDKLNIAKIGGPAYRIGMGGGAASSAKVQGTTPSDLVGAVQRGDPEMGNRLNRLVRSCIEAPQDNPVLSIHDQGAGGNGNVLKELVEDAGGRVYAPRFTLGDKSLTLEELWCAEYQESNAVLYSEDDHEYMKQISMRERCGVDVVGEVTYDKHFRFYKEDSEDVKSQPVVDFSPVVQQFLKTQKSYHWETLKPNSTPLVIPSEVTVMEALTRVLHLPSVGSKRFLTSKVDRSVGGLVAQQQCVGPMQIPIADVSVVASSYFGLKGVASSVGEQPIIGLVDAAKGARMSVMEAVASLMCVPGVALEKIFCSVNWMWPAKLPGEGPKMLEACTALSELMIELGVKVDGGKDSVGMAAMCYTPEKEVVKSPGTVVVTTYTPCEDITKVVTPDLKGPRMGIRTALLWVRPDTEVRYRLGGSALAQVFGQIGVDAPDFSNCKSEIFKKCFSLMQSFMSSNPDAVLSCHDVSEGGVIVCLFEMAMAGLCGFNVEFPKITDKSSLGLDNVHEDLYLLFSEEIGWIIEVKEECLVNLMKDLATVCSVTYLGLPNIDGTCEIRISSAESSLMTVSLEDIRAMWEDTSHTLDLQQTTNDCANEEYRAFGKKGSLPFYSFDYEHRSCIPSDQLQISDIKVAVIREEGTNGDREMAAAFMVAGFTVYDLTMSDLYKKVDLNGFRGIVFPGGFSYADVLGAATGWATAITGHKDLHKMLLSFKNRTDTFSLAVCNGCQLTARLGWQDPCQHSDDGQTETPIVRYSQNVSGRFECRWVKLRVMPSNSLFLKGMESAVLGVWSAHAEGRFDCDARSYDLIKEKNMVAFSYVDDSNELTTKYPMNPNGSIDGVAGISTSCGRHLALMPHPERCVFTWQWPDSYGRRCASQRGSGDGIASPWIRMFQNAYDWCMSVQ